MKLVVHLILYAVVVYFIGCLYGMLPWWPLLLLLGGFVIFVVALLVRDYVNEPKKWSEEKLDKEMRKRMDKAYNERIMEGCRKASSGTVEKRPSVLRETIGLWAGFALARDMMEKHQHHDDHHGHSDDYLDDDLYFDDIDDFD